ncbi:focadhesin [Taeniopygia guttata]|uniref:Focadhesin n=1 Tax=Taeniopygia guttata TaxID=59729 RepID=A0A674H9H3_TAEGU|nr:focadhesin [Taeniopygia guttata]XP_030113382.3 focadhesin [Taeniopygia guttata]XP_041567054.1 focadhesin [Taeniopygia guttata]
MLDDIKKRFEFPNAVVQSQAVSHLIAAVLKEKVSSKTIRQASDQTPALNLLWEKCCSENVALRTACCEGLVALVVEKHAELDYVLHGALDRIPSARNVHGLVKTICKLIQIQAVHLGKDEDKYFWNLYGIRNTPHPLITVLENRPDCWPVLLQQITVFFHQCPERAEGSCVRIMASFLRYLYCEPSQLREYAGLRMGLLKILLQPHGPKNIEAPSMLECEILKLLCDFIPHLQLKDLLQVTEALFFLQELFLSLLRYPLFWDIQLSQLSLQLLCFCEVCLNVTGECSSLISLIEDNFELLKEVFPVDQYIIGLALLLLQIPESQQKSVLSLAYKLLSCSEAQDISTTALTLVMPVLQILSSTTVGDCLSGDVSGTTRQQLAVNLLGILKEKGVKDKQESVLCKLLCPITSSYSSLYTTWKIMELMKEKSAVTKWLSSVKSLLPVSTQVPAHVFLLLAYLLIQENGDSLRDVLQATTEIAKADCSQVPNLIPVLIFKLGRPLEPALYREILYTLPTLGVHKVCVAQILRAIHMLGSTAKLRAIASRLMTSLWERQDRIYPELQKFLAMSDMPSVSVDKDAQWEKLIAKAACIRDICRMRPYQHGADMLAAISQVLNECTKPDQASPAAIVLQGLQALCEAEVVCIRSTWNALSPKLSCDTRPLILKALNELFSLVPSLTVNTNEFEKFKAQVISFLWNNTQNEDALVAISAYKSLSSFGSEEHTILHLPGQARPEVDSLEEIDMNEDEEDQEANLFVPGSSYIKLLSLTPSTVLGAFEEFATSLVKQEMTNMPRAVYHSALRGGTARLDQGKTVAGVPNFLLKMYERNKQPGMTPGLAAGMLLCFDLPVHMGKDGRPINRFLASRGRNFQQMLVALIHEVNIQPSEWHHSILLPQTWLGFMNRTYSAVLQGRQAELEMQLKHGKEDPDEVQYKQFTAWLWVRDMLTDVIKGASKDSPVVKGNSIFALTGLAVAVAKYKSSLSSDTEGVPETERDFIPMKHWISMVTETLLSIVNSRYQPKGQVFPWFYQKSYSGENTASIIARSCAATALSLLVPIFIVSCKEKIEEVLSMLTDRLPGKPNADESQAVQIHMGLGLGMFISRLYEEKVSDIPGQQMNLVLMKSLDVLEDCCFDTSLEYNTGCILGVGLVLSFMSHSSQTESRVHVSASLRKLCKYLDSSEDQSRGVQEVVAYSVACSSVSAFSVGIIEAAEAEKAMSKLRTLAENNQQTYSFALALGAIVHGLSACGHGKAEDLSNRLMPAWIKIVLAEGSPTMDRLAAVSGLVALVGSEGGMIQLKSEGIQSSQFHSKLNEVIRTLTQIISLSEQIGLQTNAARLLGRLHMSCLSSTQNRASVPPDFSYLPVNSFIRAAIDFAIESGKKGPESVPAELVKVALAPIALVGESHQYPPVNWASILSPLMRLNFGDDVKHLCLELAVTQAQSSQNAAMLLGMWVAPPLIYSLSMKSLKYLFMSLSLWMQHVAEDKLQSFTEVLLIQQFEVKNRTKNPEIVQCVLQGLIQAMKLPNPAQFCWSFLCQAVEKIYELLPNEIQRGELEMYIDVARCISEMTDSEINRILQVSKNNIEKATFMKVYLVSQGRLSLTNLSAVIHTVAEYHQKENILWMFLHSFYHARIVRHENTGVLKRMDWLLDLMGYIRNVAYKSTPLQNVDLKECIDFLIWLFAASVLAWADHGAPLLLGLSADWSLWKHHMVSPELYEERIGKHPTDKFAVQETLTLLPSSLSLLLGKEPWKEQTQKFIDWLINMMECPKEALSESSKDLLKVTLLALRSLAEFKKKAVWTKAYGW